MAVVITNLVFVPLVAECLGYPPPFQPLPYILLLLLSLFIGLLVKKSLAQKPPIRASLRGMPMIVYVFLGAGIFILSNVVSHFALAVVGAWLAVAVIIFSGYLFYRYFITVDFDTDLTKRKIFLVYSTFIIMILFVGFGGRQPLSNVVAFVGVGLELYFG